MIDTYNRKAKFTELKLYDHTAKEHDFMEVCEWNNGEGFDVSINEKLCSFTWGQYECLQALVTYKD
jgi:hypothetical protein